MNRARAITGGQAFVPFSVDGTAATLDMDFRSGGYHGVALSGLTVTRAGAATSGLYTDATGASFTAFAANQPRVISGSGLLVEEARTQYLGATEIPATQTTASLGTGTYTLWVVGSGSATSSAGTATITGGGAATAGTPNVFTVTVAGTVTVTVSGSLTRFQLENGAFATSYIPNTGAAGTSVSRSADVPVLSGGNFTSWFTSSTAYTLYVETLFPASPSSNAGGKSLVAISDAGFNNRLSILNAAASATLDFRAVSGGSATNPGTVASVYDALGAVDKAAVASAVGASAAIGCGNGTLGTAATPVAMPVTPNRMSIGVNEPGNGGWSCCFIRRVSYFPSRLSNASLQGLTA